MFKEKLDNLRCESPLIHNITNYVTVNDCANIILACGGSPIMADDIGEVEEITSKCQALNINIGTLNTNTVESMFAAGIRSNKLGHPVVLDPVGAGASHLRTKTALSLLEKIKFSVIRGNVSEIKTLYRGYGNTKGVDADVEDKITEENLSRIVSFAKDFSKRTGAIIAMTGAIDVVANSEKAFCIYNGHPDMSKITGTGCQLSSMVAAYVSVNQDDVLGAAAAAVSAMGLCGEIAHDRLSPLDGNASYRNYIIDAVYNLTGDMLEGGAKYEIL